jgi:hypothetical protein
LPAFFIRAFVARNAAAGLSASVAAAFIAVDIRASNGTRVFTIPHS